MIVHGWMQLKKLYPALMRLSSFEDIMSIRLFILRATQAKNKAMEKDALEGIIKGGELLRIDVSKYKSELAKMTPSVVNEPTCYCCCCPNTSKSARNSSKSSCISERIS